MGTESDGCLSSTDTCGGEVHAGCVQGWMRISRVVGNGSLGFVDTIVVMGCMA